MPLVTGTIRLSEPAPAARAASTIVQLLDVTYADESSRIVAEQILEGAGGEFSLAPASIDPQGYYTVFVHVDLDGDGRISAGDYVSTESCPVLTFGHPNEVSVTVHRVAG
jgi:uncharacterized lipoprotein YbaY